MASIEEDKMLDIHAKKIFPEEKYEPVLYYMKRYITRYKMSVENLEKRGVYQRARNSKTLSALVSLMDRMLEDNTYPIIDNFCEMLLQYEIFTQYHLEYMTVLLYPKESYENHKYSFFEVFNYLINYRSRYYKVDFNKYPYEIVNYCNKYREYCERTKIRSNPNDPSHLAFIHHSSMMLAYCYLNEVPADMLDEVLDKLRESCYEIRDYLDNNYNYEKFELLVENIIKTVFLRTMGKKSVIIK